jgi:hypothetical protein
MTGRFIVTVEEVATEKIAGKTAEEIALTLGARYDAPISAEWITAVCSSDGFRTVMARMGGSCGER